jgi:hypothetical protein
MRLGAAAARPPRDVGAVPLHTAYIERAGEGAPGPPDTFGITVPDLAALAELLLIEG